MCQRMASDTDLWLSVKAAQAKYQSTLGATKKESPIASKSGINHVNINDQMHIVNQVEMPSLPENSHEKLKRSPTPNHKRVLNQEEFDK